VKNNTYLYTTRHYQKDGFQIEGRCFYEKTKADTKGYRLLSLGNLFPTLLFLAENKFSKDISKNLHFHYRLEFHKYPD
jgi:hypothetical protein